MFNDITWKEGELQVQQYMKKLGYKILATNYFALGVELDIVAILPKGVQIKQLKREMSAKIKVASKENKKLLKQNLKTAIKEMEDLLVVTEVKARATNKFGSGSEAVGAVKQHNIIRGTKCFIKENGMQDMQVRFDVASVDSGEITYIENAF